MDEVDSEAIRRVLGGERDAYRALMDRHFSTIFRLTFRITGNASDAEEAAQEAFLRAYNKLPEFRQTAGFGTWVYRIAMNCALNLVERRTREASWNAAPLVSDYGTEMFASAANAQPEQALLDREATLLRERAMRYLTPMERTAFVLRHMEDQPMDEIARSLGVPVNSAKQAVFRAVGKLRKSLRPVPVPGRREGDAMKRLTEEDLIAYHLGELSWWRGALLRRRLQRDSLAAAQSQEIAETLHVFRGEEVQPAADAMERSWQRVRAAMPVLEPQPAAKGAGRFWFGATAGALVTASVVAVVALHFVRLAPAPVASPTGGVSNAVATQSWSRNVLSEIHAHIPGHAAQFNSRPGPLTTAPVDAVAEDPALAAHLDTAERVLTEVSHTEGPLPVETRAQVHRLMLQNAIYQRSAAQRGDLATAAVIDDLGRVLITLDAEPQHAAQTPDTFRLQMNLGGVLLDLRILHHNDSPRAQQ